MTVLNSAILDLVKLQEGATLHQPPGVSESHAVCNSK